MELLHTNECEPLLPRALLVPPLYFTSSVDCSPHFQHNVWTEIAEEILPSAGAIHHQGCPGYEIQAGPYQQWLLSCMLDLMLVYLSPNQLYNVWFIEQRRWYNVLTASLGSWPASLSMIKLHTPSFPNALTDGDASHVCLFSCSLSPTVVILMRVYLYWVAL